MPDTEALVAARLQPFVDSGALRDIAAGVIGPGGRLVTALGGARRDAVFEVGSLTKVLTAVLLAEMCGRGEVGLHQELRTLLPAGAVVPSTDGRQVTLAHLAMHTSGLPRLPPGLLKPGEAPEDPYAGFSQADLIRALAETSIGTIGEFSSYSNFGYGLLGTALSLGAGRTFAELLDERVLTPLGMSDSGVDLDPGLLARLAPGHDSGGWAVPHWSFDAMAGCGAVRSTADDLLKLAAAVLARPTGPLAGALDLTINPGVEVTVGPGSRRGLGWVILASAGRSVVWHNGGTAGFASYLAVVPEAGVALVLLASSAWEELTITGERLLAALVDLV